MKTAKIDLTGRVFGDITVISENKERNKNGHITYKCRCECGVEKDILGSSLRYGKTRSCGCLQKKKARKHGMDGTPEYTAWSSMKQRCYNKKSDRYERYGGRGIKVCQRWLDGFEFFFADMGERPNGFSIERIDLDGDYEPKNCTWADAKTQALNRSTSIKINDNGVLKTVEQMAIKWGLSCSGARKRIARLYKKNKDSVMILIKEADL